MTIDKKISFSLCFLFLILSENLAGCKTFGGIPKETEPLNYSDADVVENEKRRIASMLLEEPVRALWRSLFLNDEETINLCVETIKNSAQTAIDEKNYSDAFRFLKSLETANFQMEGVSAKEIESLLKKEVPGLQSENEFAPKNVSDCVNSTVTILVDKGIKIRNGSGIQDKVLGSGFFIDKRGYIVTNHHVISDIVDPRYEGYSRLYVKLINDPENRIPAKVVGYDSLLDLALLKTEIVPEFIFSLGSSSELSLGDKVNVIGAPLGLEGSMTAGIVSSTDRKIFTTGNVFQIDAPVNSGNSGGPCIDINLKVQAIVFAGVLQAQGLNFAIPVEYLKQELPYLYNGGEFYHSWIGGYGHTKKTGNQKTGLEVQYVMPGSPIWFAGIKAGDIIYEVDGIEIDSIESFQDVVRINSPGTLMSCRYKTTDELEKSTLIYLEKRPEDPAVEIYKSDLIQNSFVPLFGMKLVPSSTLSRKTYTIESLISGGTADEAGFSENDPVTVREIEIDNENKYILIQIHTQRRKKGFFDVMMILATPFDCPYFF